jgi:hypothetical protein
MAMNFSTRNGLNPNYGKGQGTKEEGNMEAGVGTPTHASPIGTVYVKTDATMGTTSHYRRNASNAWAPMSDD